MDTATPENAKSGKYDMLTDDGIAYIESYVPEDNSDEKKKFASKQRKIKGCIGEDYLSIRSRMIQNRAQPRGSAMPGLQVRFVQQRSSTGAIHRFLYAISVWSSMAVHTCVHKTVLIF